MWNRRGRASAGSVFNVLLYHFITTPSTTWGGSHLPELASLPPFAQQRQAGKVDGMKTTQQLSRDAIDEFKAIYQEEFGEILSDDEVQEIAMRLLRFFGILENGK
jgi:hypothetical protein